MPGGEGGAPNGGALGEAKVSETNDSSSVVSAGRRARGLGARPVRSSLPTGFADLGTQARRAALATVRHIAEGAARVSAADKRARFVIARGEVAEVHATLQTAALLGVIRQADFDRVAVLCDRVAAMLTGLIQRSPSP